MRSFRNLPIARKLTVITMAISGLTLLIAGLTLAIYEQASLRRTMERDFAILTDIFDDNVAAGLAFNDPTSIEQTLKTLSAHQRIIAAGVYDLKGKLIAQYLRSGADDGFTFPPAQLTGQRFEGDRLDSFRDVVLAGETIGAVYIGAELSELHERAWLYAGIVGGLMLVCSLVALILTERFQRIVSGPIVDLARTVATIAAEKNYAVRARKESDDELGRLIDGFNEMLAQIQARDAALQQTHDELEGRVRDRTRELLQEIAERRRSEEALRESHQRFEMVFESVPVGICLDHKPSNGGRNRLLNGAHLAICGLTRDLAVDDDIFQRLTHPDDVPRQTVLLQQLEAGEIARFSLDKRYIRPDGQIVWVALTLQRQNYADGSWQELSTVVDITGLKRAQEETVREQARFKFIFDSVPVGISLAAVGDATTHLNNPAHQRITGISAATAGNAGAYERISHPDDYRHQMELAGPFARGETDHYSTEKRYLHSDGRVVWAVLTSRKFSDAATGVPQVVTTLVDITERKEAEAKLANSLSLLNATLESTADGILVVDLQGRLTTFNRKFNEMWGIPPELLAERSAERGLAFVQAQLKDPEEFLLKAQEMYAQTDAETFDLLEFKDGRIFERYSQVQRIDGVRVGRVLCFRDITERKRAEAELRWKTALLEAQMDASPEGILMVDNQGKRILQNRLFADLWKIPREIAEHPDTERQVQFVRTLPKDAAAVTDKILHLYAHPDETSRDEIELKDGTALDRYSSPVRGKDGTYYGRIWTVRDITERKRAEAHLNETHKKLLDTSRQAGMAEVATGVLHNVGNVLNSVNVSATLVMDRVRESKAANLPKLGAMLQEHTDDLADFLTNDPKGRRIPGYLQSLAAELTREQSSVVEELGHLRKNIEHIKEIVAMQQNYAKVSGVTETVAVTELVDDALRMNESSLSRHGLEVVREFAATPTLTLDRHKLMQILVNLIRNAKHACDDAGRSDKRVTVRVTHDHRHVLIAVIDNGVGIPAENLARIFNHGFTTRSNGHGFGLHSGALAAKQLGGSLSARSDGPGTGAVFTLELPFKTEIPSL